jgi:hypothetical protein
MSSSRRDDVSSKVDRVEGAAGSQVVPWSEPQLTPDVVIQRVIDDPNLAYQPSVELVEIKSTRDLEQTYEVRARIVPRSTELAQPVRQQMNAMNTSAKTA